MTGQDIVSLQDTDWRSVYLSPFFSDVCGRHRHHIFHDTSQIPSGADIVGIAYWHNDYSEIRKDLLHLMPRTNKLLVHLDEANLPGIFTLLSDPDLQSCVFFANMVPVTSIVNVIPIISWTGSGHNVYKQDQWAKNLLIQLDYSFSADKKKFECLLGLSRRHRDLIETYYLQSAFKNEIIFSYYRDDPNLGLWDVDLSSTPFLARQHHIPVTIYNTSLFSVVAESVAFDDFAFFTEKTMKPILGKRPFVMFAGRNYLRTLRRLGFKTFGDVIDESYDDIEDAKQRWAEAWRQVELLCAADSEKVLERLAPVLQHNFDHFMDTDWWMPLRQHFDDLPYFLEGEGPYDLS